MPWSIDPSTLVPLLVREVQLLRARLAAFEAGQGPTPGGSGAGGGSPAGVGQVTHIVIHYSATFPDQNIITAADIASMHRARTPPFRCIGYRRFIRRDGAVEAGRPETEHGAHVAGQNTGKIGICWAGGLERASGPRVDVNNMTRAQEASLIRLLRDLLERYPRAKVVGLRDLAPVALPGLRRHPVVGGGLSAACAPPILHPRFPRHLVRRCTGRHHVIHRRSAL